MVIQSGCCLSTTPGNTHGGQQRHRHTRSRFDSPIGLFAPALSSGSALCSACISVSPLPNSLQTFTHSQLLLCCSLSLISQGSAPGCLQLLLAAYFARGPFSSCLISAATLLPGPLSTSLQGGVAPTSPLPPKPPGSRCLVRDSAASRPS